MSNRRVTQSLTFLLGATTTLANTSAIPLEPLGELSIHVMIDNGTDGANPTDTPVGAFQIWVDSGSGQYVQVTSSTVTTEIAKIATNTNTAVSAIAIFTGVPGVAAKVLYARTSGGATSRARVFLQA